MINRFDTFRASTWVLSKRSWRRSTSFWALSMPCWVFSCCSCNLPSVLWQRSSSSRIFATSETALSLSACSRDTLPWQRSYSSCINQYEIIDKFNVRKTQRTAEADKWLFDGCSSFTRYLFVLWYTFSFLFYARIRLPCSSAWHFTWSNLFKPDFCGAMKCWRMISPLLIRCGFASQSIDRYKKENRATDIVFK